MVYRERTPDEELETKTRRLKVTELDSKEQMLEWFYETSVKEKQE